MSEPTRSRTAERTSLRIAHTWDGQPVADDEVVEIALRLTEDQLQIELEAPFNHDPPPPTAIGSTDGLWNFEVVELFVAGTGADTGQPPYIEIELSPHGHWLGLRFAGWRRRLGLLHSLWFEASIDGDRWRGRARLPRTDLPAAPRRLAAFAIHGQAARRRYLAAQPSAGAAPDFHRPAGFVPWP